jgi:hypothetical protein
MGLTPDYCRMEPASAQGMVLTPRNASAGQSANRGVALTPVDTSAKLRALLLLEMTAFEIALAVGCSVRTVEDRKQKLKIDSVTNAERSTNFDRGLDDLYSLVTMMAGRYAVGSENIRGWLLGRSTYLEEQRPACLLGDGRFSIVREAAIAYATGVPPEDFLREWAPIARCEDRAEGSRAGSQDRL